MVDVFAEFPVNSGENSCPKAGRLAMVGGNFMEGILPMKKYAAVLGLFGLIVMGALPVSARILDGGIDPANLGKGEWLWQLSKCTDKMKGQVPSVTNVPTMMDFLKGKGIQFIIVKAGTGSSNFPSASNKQFDTNLVNAAHAAGIKIFGYTRSYGIDIAGESALADYVYNCGADGFVLDAEAEWESSNPWIGTNGPALAMQLCGMIKTNWPNKFLAHSPLPIISGHSSFPYKEFGYWCDSVMPQVYWHYWKKTATEGVDWMDSEWRPFQDGLTGIWTNAIKPLAPVGDSDRPTQDAPGIAEFYSYLKTDSNCVTVTGYKGCSFWDAEEHYASIWDAIGAGSIGDMAPSISAQPQSQALVVGQTATFFVSASGTPDPLYQWQFNGTNIVGATNSSYSLTNIQLIDAGSYSVGLTNMLGGVVSSNAILTVTTNAFFTLTATAGAGGTVSKGPNQSSYASNAVVLLTANANPGSAFTGWAGDASGSSNPLSVVMTTNKNISATFFSTNSGREIMIVESRSGGSNYTFYADVLFANSTLKSSAPGCTPLLGSRYASTNTCSITLTPVLPHAGGTYLLEVTLGAASSVSKTIMVNVSVQGGVFTNSDGIAVSNVWTSAFQPATSNVWKTVGTMVLNTTETRPTLRFSSTNTDLASGSRFYSDAYRLTFLPTAPVIGAQPVSRTVTLGGEATFFISAEGTAPLAYQWQKDGVNLPGVTTSNYTVSSTGLADAGIYNVIVANYAGSTVSSNATLTVLGMGRHSLQILSAHGIATPSVGFYTNDYGAMLTNTVSSPDTQGTTRYVCLGGTVANNSFLQVSPTNVTLALTNDATLTWNWQTQYQLATETTGNGGVTVADGWHAEGSNVVLTATADLNWYFSRWEADTNGCELMGNVITAAMSQARTIRAVFIADLSTNGTPHWWLAQYGLTNSGATFDQAETNDFDSDGLNNWQEYIAGTDPTNAVSVLKAAQTTRNVISWSAVSGRIYSVYWSTNLLKGFTNLNNNILYPTNNYTNATPDLRLNHYQIKVRMQ